MVLAFNTGPTAPNTTATGKKTRPAVKASSYMQMATSTKANGKMTRLMVLEFTSMPNLRPNTKVIGKTIQCTARELRYIQMETSIRECSNRGKDLVRGRTTFLMGRFIRGSGVVARLKGLAFASGLMGKPMKATGWITRRTAWVYSSGPMAVNIVATTATTRSTARAPTFGQTVESTSASGRAISATGKVNMSLVNSKARKGSGSRTKE